MENDSLIAALREAEASKFNAIPPEEAVDHVFSDKFRKRMRLLIRVQRTSFWQMVNTPSRRAVMMFLILLLTFGVRPDQNPLFRFAQPVYQLRTSAPPAPEPVPPPTAEHKVKEKAPAAEKPSAPAETETATAPAPSSQAQSAVSKKTSAAIVSQTTSAQQRAPKKDKKSDAPQTEAATVRQDDRAAEPAAAPEAPTDAAPGEQEKPWVEYQPLPQPETAASNGTGEQVKENAGGVFQPLPVEPYEPPAYSGAYPGGAPQTSSWSDPSYYIPNVSQPDIRILP